MLMLLAEFAYAGTIDAHGDYSLGLPGEPDAPSRVIPTEVDVSGFRAGVSVESALQPLVERLPDGDAAWIGSLHTASLSVAYRATPRWWIDAELPLHFAIGRQSGFAPGDLRVSGGYIAMTPLRGPSLALAVIGFVPSGASKRWLGTGGGLGGLVATGARVGPLKIDAHAGARFAPLGDLLDERWGVGPLAAASISAPIGAHWLSVSAVSESAGGFGPLPLEVGAEFEGPLGATTLSCGVFAGVGNAVGVARIRGVVEVGFGPRPRSPDQIEEPVLSSVPEEVPPPEVPPPLSSDMPLAALVGDRIVIAENLFFAEDRAELLVSSESVLYAVVDVLNAEPDIEHLLVEGHTNNHGSARYNRVLSDTRAAAVVQWLVAHGVDENRLLSKGYGFDRPLVAWDAPDAERVNRRVEFTVLRSDETPEDARVPDDTGVLPP